MTWFLETLSKCDYTEICFSFVFGIKRINPNLVVFLHVFLSFSFICLFVTHIHIVYRWLKDLLKLGLEKPIDTQDVYKNLKHHDAAQITDRFTELWQIESNQKRPRIFNVIRKMFINRVIVLSILYSIVDIVSR